MVGLAEGKATCIRRPNDKMLLELHTSCDAFESFVFLGISEASRLEGRSIGKGIFSSANCDQTVVVCRTS
jgi:hypothetical protein